jgi:hypothetical protein
MVESKSKSKSERYQEFFKPRLLPNLRENCPTWDCEIRRHSYGWNWVSVETFKTDLWHGIGFTGKHRVRIDLHIGGSIQRRYPHLYGELYARRSLIEGSLGLPLIFTAPGSNRAPAGRIEADRPGTLLDAETDSNDILDWTVLNVVNFRSAFVYHIRELLS